MNLEGYWIKGKEIYQVEKTHMNFFMEHKELFEMSLGEIEMMFLNYASSSEAEETLREEIFSELFRAGWIRVRHSITNHMDLWTFEFARIEEAAKPICDFITKKSKEKFLFLLQAPIKLNGIADGYEKFYSFAEGGASAFLKEQDESSHNGV